MGTKKSDNGEYTVTMVVRDDSDFLSVFSTREEPVINSEVADFLEKSTHFRLRKRQLNLRVVSSCITEDEQPVYKKAIKQYYGDCLEESRRAIRRQYVISALLAVAGLLFLLITHGIGNNFSIPFWEEFSDIIAWVFVWEMVDSLAFRTQELRVEKRKYQAFTDMNIRFEKL